jgi:predicted AlkP superfamily pyrophosphatase or phosphodiesterase
MKRTAVLNVVGLSNRLIGEHTPFLKTWAKDRYRAPVRPVVPAVTCTAQATYLTGQWPAQHGIVANGWYFRTECEIKFWRQSNHLVRAPKLWEVLREQDPDFTCAKLFWWYNMYSSADYSVTPRPNYLADGRKIPDVYSHPAGLRDALQAELGQFPLFNFWGPNTKITSSRWIADAAIYTDQKYHPTLSLVYLPHLDYNLQKFGHGHPSIARDLREIDEVLKDLITYFEGQGQHVVVLSEYGITDVHRPIHLNRLLRREGLLALRREQSWELLDAGASEAFAVCDHQIAHVYVKREAQIPRVKALLLETPGVERVLDRTEQAALHLNHRRSGELVALADADSWFSYYYWESNDRAPDFARTVDIHRKPGFDPVEMFVDARYPSPMAAAAWRLFKRKLGFRAPMNIISLDDSRIRGSHGRLPEEPTDFPVLIGPIPVVEELPATGVFDYLKQVIAG